MNLWHTIKAAFSPRPYFDAGMRLMDGYGTFGAKNRPFNYEIAVRHFNHWAYAASMLNANAVANVPRRLYVRKKPGATKLYRTQPVNPRTKAYLLGASADLPSRSVVNKVQTLGGDIEEVVENHPAIATLRTANPWQNGYELDVLRLIDLQATGNSYLHYIMGPAGVPDQVWRMPSQSVKIIPSKERYIDGYVYGKDSATEKKFGTDEVIHFRLPNPDDLFYGRGWYEAAWAALGLHQSKREMDLAKFDNMARPDYLLSLEGMTKEGADRFEASVKNMLGGTKKAGKFLTVTSKVTATPLNFDVVEVGTATRVIEEIAAVSGVPVAMLLSNDPNRSSSTAARVGWYRNTIRPYCRLDEEKLNEKWLPLFDGAEDMVLAYDPVSFEDREAQAKEIIGYVSGGILTQNEARAEIGYPPVPEGDKLNGPAGISGGAAAVAGNLAPGQNNDRQNDNPATGANP
jgi:HK97 family phage portal protein